MSLAQLIQQRRAAGFAGITVTDGESLWSSFNPGWPIVPSGWPDWATDTVPQNAERRLPFRTAGGLVQVGTELYQLPGGLSLPATWANMTDAQKVNWLSTAAVEEESALAALMRVAQEKARAGGEGAAAALKFLADNGDWFAKVALAFGIGYGAVSIVLAAVGGVVLLVVLKK